MAGASIDALNINAQGILKLKAAGLSVFDNEGKRQQGG
jgi:hypothetical protein